MNLKKKNCYFLIRIKFLKKYHIFLKVQKQPLQVLRGTRWLYGLHTSGTFVINMSDGDCLGRIKMILVIIYIFRDPPKWFSWMRKKFIIFPILYSGPVAILYLLSILVFYFFLNNLFIACARQRLWKPSPNFINYSNVFNYFINFRHVLKKTSNDDTTLALDFQ